MSSDQRDIEAALLRRVAALLTLGTTSIGEGNSLPPDIGRELFAGTLGIVGTLYGPSSPLAKTVQDASDRIMGYRWNEELKHAAVALELIGVLRAVQSDLNEGLMRSIRQEARAEILADFIGLAKQALDDGSKDVAAVLACAALEDAAKRLADQHGLDVEARDLSEVISALRSKGLVPSTQGKIMQSFVTLRNKALHAEWAKIDTSEVHGVIAFVQDFLVTRFARETGDAAS